MDIYKAVYQNAVLGIFVVDVSSGAIARVNKYGEEMFGYDEGELVGQAVEVLVPREFAESHAHYHGDFLKKPVHRPMGTGLDLHGVKKDGTRFSVEISLLPVASKNKSFAVAFVQNVDERKLAQKSMVENEARLSAVINSAVDGIITINKRGIIQTVNAAVTRLFQYKPEEIIGKNIKILMPERRSREHDGYMDNYHRTGKKKIIGLGREVFGKKKDGSEFPIYLSISEALVQGETIYTGILHDLTDRKKAEKAEQERSRWLEDYAENLENEVEERTAALRKSELKLRDALKKERELNDLKSRFVSMASHEFRTPLSTVLSSTELIEMFLDVGNREKVTKNVARIKKSVDHLNGILNDFLSLEKVETGKIEYKPGSLSLPEFIEEIKEETTNYLRPGQQLISQIGGEMQFTSDLFLLKNICYNLISNAAKYSPENKEIYLSVINRNKKLEIKVKDRGIGIPEEDKKNMFTRFFRASNVENIKGTGLGLTIVKKYTDLMQGSIDFISEPGAGTEFVVVIPV